jgi:hypothetical protein
VSRFSKIPQPIDLGENNVPEPLKLNKDLLLEDIRRFKIHAQQGTLTDSIRKALNKVEEELLNDEPGRGALSRKRRIKMRGVSSENVVNEKRVRKNSDWPKSKSMVVYEKTDVPENTGKRVLTGIQPMDRAKILTSRFGKEYAKDKLKYAEGIVRKRIGQMVDVLWDGTTDGLTMRSHKSQLKK